MSPGMIPAINNAPTSIRAKVANNTASAEGGMIIARPPVPRIGPMDICFLYPRSVISGTIRLPSNAVEPIDDPDSVENAVPPRTVT